MRNQCNRGELWCVTNVTGGGVVVRNQCYRGELWCVTNVTGGSCGA